MPVSRTRWTVAMLAELPDDGNRYEIIDGQLFVTPAPSFVHQFAINELYVRLNAYVQTVGLCMLTAPAAVTFTARREVQPDLLVLPRVAGKRPRIFEDVGVLTLAVEVLSPGTARVDRTRKRDLYADEKVPEYWIIDTAMRVIERWRPDSEWPEILATTLTWRPAETRETFNMDVFEYFKCVLDD